MEKAAAGVKCISGAMQVSLTWSFALSKLQSTNCDMCLLLLENK